MRSHCCVRVGMPVEGPARCTSTITAGNFGEIGKAQKLLHQRDAGSRGRREGARAVPAGADHHADRGKLVLGLDDGVAVLLVAVRAIARAMPLECFGDRGGRRDRIPGAHRRAAIDRAERDRAVALDEDAVADGVRLLHPQADRMLEVHHHVVAAEVQRVHVRLDQRVLGAELLGNQLLDHADVHVEQRRERAHIDDVLEQLALARIDVFAIADRGERHADHRDVVAEARGGQRLGRIVEQVAALARSRRRPCRRSAGSSRPSGRRRRARRDARLR